MSKIFNLKIFKFKSVKTPFTVNCMTDYCKISAESALCIDVYEAIRFVLTPSGHADFCLTTGTKVMCDLIKNENLTRIEKEVKGTEIIFSVDNLVVSQDIYMDKMKSLNNFILWSDVEKLINIRYDSEIMNFFNHGFSNEAYQASVNDVETQLEATQVLCNAIHNTTACDKIVHKATALKNKIPNVTEWSQLTLLFDFDEIIKKQMEKNEILNYQSSCSLSLTNPPVMEVIQSGMNQYKSSLLQHTNRMNENEISDINPTCFNLMKIQNDLTTFLSEELKLSRNKSRELKRQIQLQQSVIEEAASSSNETKFSDYYDCKRDFGIEHISEVFNMESLKNDIDSIDETLIKTLKNLKSQYEVSDAQQHMKLLEGMEADLKSQLILEKSELQKLECEIKMQENLMTEMTLALKAKKKKLYDYYVTHDEPDSEEAILRSEVREQLILLQKHAETNENQSSCNLEMKQHFIENTIKNLVGSIEKVKKEIERCQVDINQQEERISNDTAAVTDLNAKLNLAKRDDALLISSENRDICSKMNITTTDLFKEPLMREKEIERQSELSTQLKCTREYKKMVKTTMEAFKGTGFDEIPTGERRDWFMPSSSKETIQQFLSSPVHSSTSISMFEHVNNKLYNSIKELNEGKLDLFENVLKRNTLLQEFCQIDDNEIPFLHGDISNVETGENVENINDFIKPYISKYMNDSFSLDYSSLSKNKITDCSEDEIKTKLLLKYIDGCVNIRPVVTSVIKKSMKAKTIQNITQRAKGIIKVHTKRRASYNKLKNLFKGKEFNEFLDRSNTLISTLPAGIMGKFNLIKSKGEVDLKVRSVIDKDSKSFFEMTDFQKAIFTLSMIFTRHRFQNSSVLIFFDDGTMPRKFVICLDSLLKQISNDIQCLVISDYNHYYAQADFTIDSQMESQIF